ncbi:pteridine reductase [Psychrobium sp. 1_MG-2023]|uniref:pteridine reductase n=1 Tax=Psychrobium sp. 1_MG-2023 TaxID=3062624 RepID=UPI002732D1A1|nr:pteridine reductase [Psychrobium sp. 1_MG-2023]MDP2561669.1 pteridine reductase [Psychrobium sp. 1_MG-2023]
MTPVALITGAAKRLGASTATHLHGIGYDVVIHYHRSHQQAEDLCSQLNALRPNSAVSMSNDLTNLATLNEISDFVEHHYGRLDVLINNASSFYPTPISELQISDYNDLIATNMSAPLFLAQACQGLLTKNNGVIINMCDIHAKKPLKQHTAYCMAKAGLQMMTYSLANELAPNIRVNGIAPGAIEWPNAGISQQAIDQVVSDIPLARKGASGDIAQAIAYLIEAKYVTGHILTVDGGRHYNASRGA